MQRINDKLKSLCKFCLSNLDKPCAWISLGNEYCDRIMDIQSELNNRIPRKDIEDKIEKVRCETTWNYNDWKYDEKVYNAEHNMINIIEKEILNKE